MAPFVMQVVSMFHSLFENLGLSSSHNYIVSSDTVQAAVFLSCKWVGDTILLLRILGPGIITHFSLVCLHL